MKPSTREWTKKAEGDYRAAMALARQRKVPLHDQVCFHCQQCSEKYLKAVLEEAGFADSTLMDFPCTVYGKTESICRRGAVSGK
jgi:HEPN domain-containing protein